MYPQQDYPLPLSYCPDSGSASPSWGSHSGPVARRNERERKRVRLVNMGFAKLRQYIPVTGRPGKRLSKVETLRSAIDYIRQLRQMLRQPPDPPYYYPPPPPTGGYRCDFGCPCTDGMPDYTTPDIIMSYVPDSYAV